MGWDKPVDALLVSVYIARVQQNAIVEENHKMNDKYEFISKRTLRSQKG